MQLFFQTGVSDNQPAIVQYIMTHEVIDEVSYSFFEFGRFLVQLAQRFSQTMRNLHVSATKLSH